MGSSKDVMFYVYNALKGLKLPTFPESTCSFESYV